MEKRSEVDSRDDDHNKWVEAQDSLKKKLVTEDDYTWKLGELKYIGGADISFLKDDSSVACGTLVVLDFKTLDLVYEDSAIIQIDVPYVPGFLAFREAPVFLQLLKKMQDCSHPFYPQLLVIDGNGILHPRGFGSACHLGVLANLPTIGIGKNLHHVDGLTNSRVRKLLEAEENCNVDFVSLTGDSGNTLGAAMRSSKGSFKPIFVSVGHRVSLASAVEVVKRTCKYRVPEPIRQASKCEGLHPNFILLFLETTLLQHYIFAYDIDDVLDDLATEAMHREFTHRSEPITTKI